MGLGCFHPHVHFVIPGGGIGPDLEWVPCRPRFFLPMKVQSASVLRRCRVAPTRRRLPPLSQTLKESDWVVYAKKPFGGPQKVLDSLGRYIHRVALSNDRILDAADGWVSFQWRDYRAKEKYGRGS